MVWKKYFLDISWLRGKQLPGQKNSVKLSPQTWQGASVYRGISEHLLESLQGKNWTMNFFVHFLWWLLD